MPIIICTGSRFLPETERAAVWRRLDELDANADLLIRVGDCRTGLDAFVQAWARRRWMIVWRMRCLVYEADWDRFGKAAGPKRNAVMVADGADEMHAWFAPPPALNRGTTGCCKLARRAGIPVVEYGREGQQTEEYEQDALPLEGELR